MVIFVIVGMFYIPDCIRCVQLELNHSFREGNELYKKKIRNRAGFEISFFSSLNLFLPSLNLFRWKMQESCVFVMTLIGQQFLREDPGCGGEWLKLRLHFDLESIDGFGRFIEKFSLFFRTAVP